MTQTAEANSIVQGLAPLLPSAIETLRDYLASDETGRGERDRAKRALQMVNTAINLQRSIWNQQRHDTNVARMLSDGDLDVFQKYVAQVNPSLNIRKIALPDGK